MLEVNCFQYHKQVDTNGGMLRPNCKPWDFQLQYLDLAVRFSQGSYHIVHLGAIQQNMSISLSLFPTAISFVVSPLLCIVFSDGWWGFGFYSFHFFLILSVSIRLSAFLIRLTAWTNHMIGPQSSQFYNTG